MKTTLGHLLFNVEAQHLRFYKDLATLLGWQVLHEDGDYLGVGDGGETSLWFSGTVKDVQNDHDGPGMNHLAFHTETPADVDVAVAELRERGVEMLFGTPCRRTEFEGDGQIYYSAMFATPDHMLIEVVYSGPETA